VNPPLPVVSGADAVNALVEAHLTVIVPLHRELAPGTLRSIIRQSELSVEEFLELL
jgi:hypothetical protein